MKFSISKFTRALIEARGGELFALFFGHMTVSPSSTFLSPSRSSLVPTAPFLFQVRFADRATGHNVVGQYILPRCVCAADLGLTARFAQLLSSRQDGYLYHPRNYGLDIISQSTTTR